MRRWRHNPALPADMGIRVWARGGQALASSQTEELQKLMKAPVTDAMQASLPQMLGSAQSQLCRGCGRATAPSKGSREPPEPCWDGKSQHTGTGAGRTVQGQCSVLGAVLLAGGHPGGLPIHPCRQPPWDSRSCPPLPRWVVPNGSCCWLADAERCVRKVPNLA